MRHNRTFTASLIVLGTLAALLPSLASSEGTPSVSAVGLGPGYYGERYAWSPAQTSVGAGGAVTFSTGSTAAPHGVVWTSSVKPSCSSSVPVEGNAAEHWSGTCTFTQPGTYTFHCAVHAEMTGTVTVAANGTTTTTMSTAPSTSSTATSPTPAPTPTTTTGSPTPTPKAPVHKGNARKLAKALRACRRGPRAHRKKCERAARRRYGVRR